jgi:asparagine synthase (glutamine-hydrolysing)
MIESICRESARRELAGTYCFTSAAPLAAESSTCELDGRVDGHEFDAAETALALYDRQGAAGLRCLTGDWSLVIRDNARGAIVLASDHAGARPLYYFRSADSVSWDTSPARLAARTGQRQLNPDYVAEYLATGFAVDASPYGAIRPVPAGMALAFSDRGVARTILWTPSGETSATFHSEAEYEDRFRELFEEAVAARLHTAAPVAAELSGGVDSSSIVCMADRLIASGRVAASGLMTFSYDAPASPDRPYMEEVERCCRTARAIHLDVREFPFLTARLDSASRPTLAESRLAETRRRMEDAGSTVLLTGQLGDLITGNMADDSIQAADYLRRFQFAAGFRESLAWSQSLRLPVYSLLWKAMRAACGGAADRQADEGGEDSLTPLFHRRAGELARRRAADSALANAAPSRRRRTMALRQLFGSRFFQCPDPLNGLLYSHPYTHRPLVEFLLAVPAKMLCRPDEPRWLMRRALRGIVPDAILRRRSKGNYEGTFLKAMRACAAGLAEAPESMLLARRGYVDARSAGRRLFRLGQGLPCNAGQLRQIILLELWLRQRVAEGAME